ncbi:MAG: hypothetical protein KDB22_26825 [Planctomycetales bacterium]|nr:hypothetical protein [Planctomycetales bacterium]
MADEQQPDLRLEFDESIHNVDAIKRAAYAMMKRAVCNIRMVDGVLVCELTAASDEPLEGLARDFRREVLDQDLRLSIEAQTEPLRNLVLGLAFSRVGQNGEVH